MKEYKYRENINDNDGNTVGVREMVVPNNVVEQIKADAIEQFKPFFKILMEYDNLEWICDEICGEFVNPQTDEPWCFENCKDMNFECVKKWLELKEQNK